MKKEELRIGNYVNDKHGVQVIVYGITDSVHLKNNHLIPLCWIVPIPLTEEWLMKLGFESYFGSDPQERPAVKEFSIFVNGFNFKIVMLSEDVQKFTYFFTNGDIDVEHVHQLQNLYFAITGQELTLKQ